MDKLFEKNNIVLNEIKNLIINMRNKYFFTIEGSYCMYKKDDDNFNKFVNSKISNLCSCINSLTSDNLNICEIGFNAGHSATFIANSLVSISPEVGTDNGIYDLFGLTGIGGLGLPASGVKNNVSEFTEVKVPEVKVK